MIWGKAEFLNPGGSVKDRAALRIIERARLDGSLAPGQTVVEMTSGNMGSGLAVVCACYGHPFVAIMSRGNSPERARMLRALGAEVVLVEQVDGVPGNVTGQDIQAAVHEATQIASIRGAYYVDQFNNPASIEAHEIGTGPEILSDMGGGLDAFVATVGSGGTFIGVSKCLKQSNQSIVCAAVEPQGAEVLAGRPVTKARHLIQGTGYGSVPPHWQPGLVGVYLSVSDEEVQNVKHRLATEEGLHVGFSAAANVCASAKLLEQGWMKPGAQVVTILCDTGLKYG